MTELIPAQYTEGTISTSRTFHEMLKIQGGDTAYGKLAALLDVSMPMIDTLGENLGRYLAAVAVKKQYDKQFFDPKYGKVKNFLTRNIYLDPLKKQKMETERTVTGMVVAGAAEVAVKFGARAFQAWSARCDKVAVLGEVYSLLNSFAFADEENSDIRQAKIELSKIRNSFPLSDADKKRFAKKYLKNPAALEDITSISALSGENSGALRENISYMLFALYCRKYGDDERGLDILADYYDFLGFHGNYAKELIRENRETYANITDDQNKYLKMSRGMVREMFVTVPEIPVERLRLQADAMAKFDPYSLRRKKVQHVGAAGVMSLAGVFNKRPDLVIQAGSTALSQLQLENNDNAVEFLEKLFKSKGIDNDAFGIMFKQSRDITSGAKNTFDVY